MKYQDICLKSYSMMQLVLDVFQHVWKTVGKDRCLFQLQKRAAWNVNPLLFICQDFDSESQQIVDQAFIIFHIKLNNLFFLKYEIFSIFSIITKKLSIYLLMLFLCTKYFVQTCHSLSPTQKNLPLKILVNLQLRKIKAQNKFNFFSAYLHYVDTSY